MQQEQQLGFPPLRLAVVVMVAEVASQQQHEEEEKVLVLVVLVVEVNMGGVRWLAVNQKIHHRLLRT
jgi:hypothetical protein